MEDLEGQSFLFEGANPPSPEWHWVGMPEFVQEKQDPFTQVIVRFETEEDMVDFSRIIGQKITPDTKSLWHPEYERGKTCRPFRYADEE